MKRLASVVAAVGLAALFVPALSADVKTTRRTLLKFEGVLGIGYSMFGGSAARDGVVTTIAVKGGRKSDIGAINGSIVDMTEQKVYTLDVKKKEYRVETFDQIRQRMKDMMAENQKRADQQKAEEKDKPKSDVEYQTDYTLTETKQTKTIAGYETREVVMTASTHEKGKKIEDAGGSIMTIHSWIGPKIAALEEVRDFDTKYFRAVYGEALGIDAAQMGQMFAMYPQMKPLMEKLQAEGAKIQGTVLSSVLTSEIVQTPEQMKSSQRQQDANNSGANGLGGFLAGRIAANKTSSQKQLLMTVSMDTQTIAPAATDADVAIPAGYKEKK